MSYEDKMKRCEEVVESFDLQKCIDTREYTEHLNNSILYATFGGIDRSTWNFQVWILKI